jgi:hypothetical protein
MTTQLPALAAALARDNDSVEFVRAGRRIERP